MKKLLSVIILTSSLIIPVLCQEMPKDVPADHYAYDAISDLVDRGINVSQGYPDGTFRGNKNTSRYENAYFMASLALSLRRATSVEVDLSDIKEEISWLRNELMSLKQQPEIKGRLKYSGSMELKSKLGSILAYDEGHRSDLGPETNYRFKYSIEKALGNDANVKLNLDTMDGAFNSPTTRAFATKILDIEGNLTTDIGLENPVKIRTIFGPGSVVHREENGVAPSEDYTYFSRPRPTFMLETAMGGYSVTGAYAARGVQGNGRVGTSEVYVQLGRKIGRISFLGSVEVVSTSRYVFIDFINPPSESNNFMQELAFFMSKNDNVSDKLLIGSSSTDNPYSQYYLNYELYLNGLNGKGSAVNFKFHSVGTGYRLPFDALEFISLDLFDKKILDGTVDVGLEVIQPLTASWILKSKSDWVANSQWKMGKDIPGSSFTQELSLDYDISQDIKLNSFYRYYLVPSKIGQFMNAVPEESDLIGLGLTYRF